MNKEVEVLAQVGNNMNYLVNYITKQTDVINVQKETIRRNALASLDSELML